MTVCSDPRPVSASCQMTRSAALCHRSLSCSASLTVLHVNSALPPASKPKQKGGLFDDIDDLFEPAPAPSKEKEKEKEETKAAAPVRHPLTLLTPVDTCWLVVMLLTLIQCSKSRYTSVQFLFHLCLFSARLLHFLAWALVSVLCAH